MIVLEEMTHRTTLAGLITPWRVRLDSAEESDDLILYADATTPETGAKLYTREGYRAGEIALAYVDPLGEMIRFDEDYGSLSALTFLSPLGEQEVVDLNADRAKHLIARDGVESEPDWFCAQSRRWASPAPQVGDQECDPRVDPE
jgi:hypothetical protein